MTGTDEGLPRTSWLPRAPDDAALPLDAWEVRDVTEWEIVSPESRGKRAKCWVEDPNGDRWLRKEPWVSRPFEPTVETFALRLARAAHLPAPESHPCTWKTEEGAPGRGIIVRAFADVLSEDDFGGRQLQDGAVILTRTDPSYDPLSHPMHTLDRVHQALAQLETQHPGATLLAPFMQLMAFDLWVGNTDRHQHNWSILQQGQRPALAPLYDPAACLGVELTEEKPLLDPARRTDALVERYISRAPSGFGDGAKLIPLVQVADQLRSWPGWTEYAVPWLATFRAVVDTRVSPFLNTVPDAWLPNLRRDLAAHLLAARLRWLESLFTCGVSR